MAVRSEKLSFVGSQGDLLAGRFDLPEGPPIATVLFAHCFTCSKDTFAAARIAGALAQNGFAVLRFDFTGLGSSDGEFANTTFSSNVDDLVAASDHLRMKYSAPAILVGHSLGGAAVLAATSRAPEVKAVCTIGAPDDPSHVRHLFAASTEEIAITGEAEVALAGRTFTIRRAFLEDVAAVRLATSIAQLRRPLLLFHSPTDEIVGIDCAGSIYAAAKHPKSFVAIDGADHLLTHREDAVFVSGVIAAWAVRYLAYP